MMLGFLATLALGYAGLIGEPYAVCLGSLLPALAWVSYVRSWDYREPEPYALVAVAFVVGAASAAPAILAELLLDTGRPLVNSVLVAPLVEEFVKPLGLYLLWRSAEVNDELDVVFYAVTSAMGFAWVENLLAGISGLGEMGVGGWALAAAGRGLMSTVGHAADSGVMGWGLSRLKFGGGSSLELVKWYGLAAALHGGWNWLVSATSALAAFIPGLLLAPLVLAKLLSGVVDAASKRSPFRGCERRTLVA